jgi:hypothetical protein
MMPDANPRTPKLLSATLAETARTTTQRALKFQLIFNFSSNGSNRLSMMLNLTEIMTGMK